MPFPRPTLADLRARTSQQVAGRLGLGGLLPRSRLGALATAVAGASHELHGHLDWIFRQVFPDTAEAEELARWAAVWGVTRLPATTWSGTVRFSGSNGVVVPEGTRLRRDDGQEYETTELVTVASGTADAPLVALEVGALPNLEAGSSLRLLNPIAGLQTTAAVLADGLVPGVDQEDDDSLRERLLERIQLPPHGGAAHDYVAWAREVAGVTRAWVIPLYLGAGTVGVTFVTDDAAGGLIPDAPKVAEVQAYIDLVRPVTAAVTVFAPAERTIAATIAVEPNSQAVRDAVTAALRDLLRREGGPGATLLISHVREAISTAPGETDHEVQLWDGEEPDDLDIGAGEVATLGTITWA